MNITLTNYVNLRGKVWSVDAVPAFFPQELRIQIIYVSEFNRRGDDVEVTNDPGKGCFLTQVNLGRMTHAMKFSDGVLGDWGFSRGIRCRCTVSFVARIYD